MNFRKKRKENLRRRLHSVFDIHLHRWHWQEFHPIAVYRLSGWQQTQAPLSGHQHFYQIRSLPIQLQGRVGSVVGSCQEGEVECVVLFHPLEHSQTAEDTKPECRNEQCLNMVLLFIRLQLNNQQKLELMNLLNETR